MKLYFQECLCDSRVEVKLQKDPSLFEETPCSLMADEVHLLCDLQRDEIIPDCVVPACSEG